MKRYFRAQMFLQTSNGKAYHIWKLQPQNIHEQSPEMYTFNELLLYIASNPDTPFTITAKTSMLNVISTCRFNDILINPKQFKMDMQAVIK